MDKNKFWLGGRLFNMASPRLGTPTNSKARSQVGRPKARPQRKRKACLQCKGRPHVRKLAAPMQRKARPQIGRPNAKQIRNENIHTREH
jgi:hypothetical protein